MVLVDVYNLVCTTIFCQRNLVLVNKDLDDHVMLLITRSKPSPFSGLLLLGMDVSYVEVILSRRLNWQLTLYIFAVVTFSSLFQYLVPSSPTFPTHSLITSLTSLIGIKANVDLRLLQNWFISSSKLLTLERILQRLKSSMVDL